MGIRILEGEYDRSHNAAVLIDSVTDRAFGPMFDDAEEAEDFLRFCQAVLEKDPRSFSGDEFDAAIGKWSRFASLAEVYEGIPEALDELRAELRGLGG